MFLYKRYLYKVSIIDYYTMSEILSSWFNMYKNLITIWSTYYNNLIGSVENTCNNFTPDLDKNNVIFFNGFLKGYETAQRDYSQLLPGYYNGERNTEPADFYA